MERRRKPVARNRSRNVSQKAVAKNSAVVPLSLPNIANLISDGEITVGVLRPVGCVATATDGYNCLAMLVRRRGETLAQLLIVSIKPSTKRSPKTSIPTKSIPELLHPKCPHDSFVDT